MLALARYRVNFNFDCEFRNRKQRLGEGGIERGRSARGGVVLVQCYLCYLY